MPSSAEITLNASPDGDRAFIVLGCYLTGAESAEITVVYNSTIFSNPRVTLQGGTVTDTFDSSPGQISFKVNRGDDHASQFEVHVNFDKKKDSQGGVIAVTGKPMEPDGTYSSPTQVSLDLGVTASRPEKSVVTEETATSGNMAHILRKAEQSVLQRFKEFRGERSLKAFVALFERSPGDMLVQEPPVILSDGKTPVRITLALQPKGGGEPNFALSDAKLVHLGKESEKGWVITALPKEGTWSASLIMNTDEGIIEYPLVVAPPVQIQKGITERTFVAELDRMISAQVGGGKGEHEPLRNILYEYVFTANYLASPGGRSPKMTSEGASLMDDSK
jgi:hypothetical protein